MTVATRLQVIPVVSSGHINCMRTIRNSGSAGYSGDDVQIGQDEQMAWWYEHHSAGRLHAWLYAKHGVVVGFGMIMRRDNGEWSPSAGVLPEHQGRGYGGWIVSDLAHQALSLGLTLYAKARLSNEAAVRTHHHDFWEELGRDDDYVYFRSLE